VNEPAGRHRRSGRVEAAIDRIVEGIAVLLTDDDEIHIPTSMLPADVREGSIVTVILDGSGEVVGVEPTDPSLEAEQRHELEGRLARLRRERSGGRFDGDDA
jgi:hypothetical protein